MFRPARARLHVLTGGVSKRTVLVQRANGQAWVIKQALSKLRVEVDWFCSPERIRGEGPAASRAGRQKTRPARSSGLQAQARSRSGGWRPPRVAADEAENPVLEGRILGHGYGRSVIPMVDLPLPPGRRH